MVKIYTKQRLTSYPRAKYLKELSRREMTYEIIFKKDRGLEFTDISYDENSCWQSRIAKTMIKFNLSHKLNFEPNF